MSTLVCLKEALRSKLPVLPLWFLGILTYVEKFFLSQRANRCKDCYLIVISSMLLVFFFVHWMLVINLMAKLLSIFLHVLTYICMCNSYDMNSTQEERDLIKEQKRCVLSLHSLGLSYEIIQQLSFNIW